ncbi:hypothetical protein W97_07274 [Coniosporium apollinis CBS 100218]|uniref:Uncharacterized protein n=1 Tax=Coniosporium apollinis (strain CBS 100218) TaxID=1168221 RepID=R7Z2K2_CONA1|nr:uncharacterized protein W97_07274 [Coniosporium apollinis CBS 100218]EON68126.1 hypothetical protein W97_07274 [Coniosporium apollinis CBS 100218]
MSSSSDNRLTALTPDNHQPWLWFTHVFTVVFVTLAAIVRVSVKRTQAGIGDGVLLLAHLLYIVYWTIILFSLLNSVGKSERVTSDDEEINASKPARWIVFTLFEAILEFVPVLQVATAISIVQVDNEDKDLGCDHLFLQTDVLWIPAWMHLSAYLTFLHSGRPNIDIVPTLVGEELWVAFALVSASVPVLMRVANKFTTTGVALGATIMSRSRETPVESFKMKSTSSGKLNSLSGKIGLKSKDEPVCTTCVAARRGEAASIGSTAGSQVGILKEVQFDVLEQRVQEKPGV